MEEICKLLCVLLIPFLGTTIGAATVFMFKGEIKPHIQKMFLGFAAGVMLAASVWSLIIPSIEITGAKGDIAYIPAAVGIILGAAFLLLLDSIIPHLHLNENRPEGIKSNFKKSTMLILAVTLHNIPEGMAVGVVFASILSNNMSMSLMGVMALTIGIALQNFPEGATISLPLKTEGFSRKRSFVYGMLSGIVEPIAAVLTILAASVILPMLPYLLAFSAGAMIYVVVEELIPESQNGEHSNIGTIALILGFVLMMVLDIALK